MVDKRRIIWRDPNRFETEIQIEHGEQIAIDIELLATLGQSVSFSQHNPLWPSWLTIEAVDEQVGADGKTYLVRLIGDPPDTTDGYEALLRASDGTTASDRTFRFFRVTKTEEDLEWVLPTQWVLSDDSVAVPSVREGDEYHITLEATGGRRTPLFILAESGTLEIPDDAEEGLPHGITLNGNTGIVEGVPDDVESDTDYYFQITLTDGTTSLPRLFVLTVEAASIDVPHWYTPPGSLGILLGGQDVEIILDARNVFGKEVIFTLEAGELPDGLSLSTDGFILGEAAPVSSLQTYSFTVRAQTTGDTEYRLRSFTISVLSAAVKGVIEWITPEGNIGNVVEETSSHLSVRALLRDQPDVALHYIVGTPSAPPMLPLVDYDPRDSLPPGLNMTDCDNHGLLNGRPQLGTNGEHDFTVLVYSGDDSNPSHVSAERTFSVTISEHYPSEHVELRCPLIGVDRLYWRDWLKEVPIEDSFLYRRCDYDFGRVTEPSMYVVGGMEANGDATFADVIGWMGPHHRTFKVMLGSPEIAIVRGEDSKTAYEIIYVPTYGITPEEEIATAPPFPTSVANLRREILSRASLAGDKEELLPQWMRQQQIRRNGQTLLGYQSAFVVAYLKPNTARTVLTRWRQLGLFNRLDGRIVQIDRYDVHHVRAGGLSQRDVKSALFPYAITAGTGFNIVTEPPPSENYVWSVPVPRGLLRLTSDALSLTYTALIEASPLLGQLEILGQYPVENQLATPAAAQLELTGAISNTEQQLYPTPAEASLTLTGEPPVVLDVITISVSPDVAEIVLEGYAPHTGAASVVASAPEAAEIHLFGSDIGLDLTYTVSLAATDIDLTSVSPEVIGENTAVVAQPLRANIGLTTFSPTLLLENTHVEAAPTPAEMTLDAQPFLMVANTAIAPMTFAFEITGEIPVTLVENTFVVAEPQRADLDITTEEIETVTFNGAVEIANEPAEISIDGIEPTVVAHNYSVIAIVEPAEITITGETPSIETITNEHGDEHWQSVVLYMPFEGANNSTVFADESGKGHTFTRVGSPVVSTAQFHTGSSSFYNPGTTTQQANRIYSDTHTDFLFNGDFTIEGWVYPLSQTDNAMAWISSIGADSALGSYQFSRGATANIGFVITPVTSNYTWVYSSAGAVPLNTWTHVAVDRHGSTIRIYINGVTHGSTLTSSQTLGRSGVEIGAGNNTNDNQDWNGYIDLVRITKGVARYQGSDFTPPLE